MSTTGQSPRGGFWRLRPRRHAHRGSTAGLPGCPGWTRSGQTHPPPAGMEESGGWAWGGWDPPQDSPTVHFTSSGHTRGQSQGKVQASQVGSWLALWEKKRPDFSVWSLLPSRAAGLNPTVLWDPCLYVLSCFSRVLFATPWTVAHQAPQSMGFPGQEHCRGLPFPSHRAPPDPGIKQMSPASPALAGRFFTTAPPGTPQGMPEELQKPPPSLQLQGFCLTKVEVGPGTRNFFKFPDDSCGGQPGMP